MAESDRRHPTERYRHLEEEMLLHLAGAQERQSMWTSALTAGASRMERLEKDLEGLKGLTKIAKGFLAALCVASALLAALIGLFTWVMIQKNDDIKIMQNSIQTITVQNAEMLINMKNLFNSQQTESSRLDRHIDGLNARREERRP
jgi:hypothetical protein